MSAECRARRGVLVTGGAQGIGRAVAERFVAAGDGVVILDIAGQIAQQTAAELAATGARVIAVEGSADDRADIRRAIGACTGAFGHLDVLAAVAGIAIGKPLLEVSDEDWLRVISVNLHGAFRCTQEAARVMAADRGGAVVAMASTNAFHVEQNLAAYNTSKGAIVAFVRSAAMDLAKAGVRVNAVAPGLVRTKGAEWLINHPQLGPAYTDRVPLQRIAEPSDVADAVWFLASPQASYMTGQMLVVDGGYTLGDPYPDLEVATPWRAADGSAP